MGRGSAVRLERPQIIRALSQISPRSLRATYIFCPWLKDVHNERDIWTSILAIHDINEEILSKLRPSETKWNNVYVGIFAVDVLRTPAELIRSIKVAGIGGVINFPSTSFIGDGTATIFNHLSLGIDREIDVLQECGAQGLRIAGVVGSLKAAQRLSAMGADFLITHRGPPIHDHDKSDSKDADEKLKLPNNTPLFRLAELIYSKN